MTLQSRIGHRSMLRSLCLLQLAISSVTGAQTARKIAVIGHDYAFTAPDTVQAGAALFSLRNQGAVRHEVVVLLAKQGRTLAEYIQATTPEERRALNDGVIGVIFAEPGQSAPGRLLTDLEKGRTYILICGFRDAPDKPQHFRLGMAGVLHVK